MYEVIASGPERRFEITGGLREGYATGLGDPVHTLAEVIALHHEWQRGSKVVLGVMVAQVTVSYGWPEGGTIRCADEPGFVLWGMINVLYARHASDSTALGQIQELAAFLAERLGQQRMYCTFHGRAYILERGALAGHEALPEWEGEEG